MLMSNPFDNPDYLKLQQTKKALEDYGKSEVLKYEKYRVSMFSQSLAEKVQENKDPQAGYNIDPSMSKLDRFPSMLRLRLI